VVECLATEPNIMGLNLANCRKDKTNGYDKLVNKFGPQKKTLLIKQLKKEPSLQNISELGRWFSIKLLSMRSRV
jgi:hypothetical protein